MQNEYRQLIRDTLHFLQNQLPYRPASKPLDASSQKSGSLKSEPLPARKEKANTNLIPPVSAPAALRMQEESSPPPKVTAAKPPLLQPSKQDLVQEPMEELRLLIEKTSPHYLLHRDVPSDAAAERNAEKWKENIGTIQVALLSFGEQGASLQFLQNLTKAIDNSLCPALLIDGERFEREERWKMLLEEKELKWIIAPSRSLGKSPILTHYYREIPAKQERLLADIPLFFLLPIQEYLKESSLKRTLWETLCRMLQK